jgi:regulator of nucleoside diphosphate kinase
MLATKPRQTKTTVYVAEAEYERLHNLAASEAPGAALLRQELGRAILLRESEGPSAFVRLNSVVEYLDLATGRTRTVTLVAPDQADIDQGRISVVTPVGAALLGVVPGESFSWTMDDGRPRVITVVRVADAP